MSAATFVKPICTGQTVIDVIMQSAERASGVLELALQRLMNGDNTDQDLFYALCEMTDIRAITEAYQDGEYDQSESNQPEAKLTYAANPAEACPEVAILAKLINFAEITVEQAAGIDAELKRYRAAAVVNGSAPVLEAETEKASRPSRTSRSK
ncbi:hypothetical protein CWO84_10630 [Methylomonas sp. Kb3]|uniref:hypothetical protein n=1 Tax=Methylomonas sp. Kb3 TaxID=1611544 RepID=UPI000C336D8D|nr:hypothetical protein [Methylomonas sp. Kb3]PKD40437.1 hypothetical protein CWO84_10630 [Methylomonas sp. Kb3]